jgi:transcriptional regulator with XRE-family HTH domain
MREERGTRMKTEKKSTGGYVLRHFRRRSGLSQTELAERAGISAGYVAMLEKGQRGNPSATIIERIAGALSLDGTDRADFLAAMGVSSESSVQTVQPPKTPLERILTVFTSIPAGSPEGPPALDRLIDGLMAMIAEKSDTEETRTALKSARLLGMGFFCDATKGSRRKSPMGKRKGTPDFEIELADEVKKLMELFVDGRIPASKRVSLARELVSFAQWKLRENKSEL